ncbi:hypothetical protein AB8A31_26215 [Tardiphaga sp. 804_B3_N1_9]|jgi:hypothetical protein|uniref:hypothetical protein n=1 Tax=Tardiphaga TaxID=1395974 RepID=UPI001586CC2B|nr:hypothetical protein [Tardiphaga robiniae]NUU42396.1 hypothetical protein [Tardiphaga robiniae]
MNKSPLTRTEGILILAAIAGAVWMFQYWRHNLSESAQKRQQVLDAYNLKREKDRNDPPKYLKPEAL